MSARVPQGACEYNNVCGLAATFPPDRPEYCILHDPTTAGKNRADFDQAIYNHFVAGRCDLGQVRFPEGGGPYNFTGKVFPSTLDFIDAACVPPLQFQDCQFQSGLHFSGGQFGSITIIGGRINGGVHFNVRTFSEGLTFQAMIIDGPVTLRARLLHLNAIDSEIHGVLSLSADTVATLNLDGSKLLDGLTLQAGDYQESRNLRLASLRGVLDWRESTIVGDLDLSHLNLEPGASIDLSRATIANRFFFGRGVLPDCIRLDGTSLKKDVHLEAPLGWPRLRVIAKDHPPRFAGGVTIKNVDLSECLLLGNTFPRFDISNIAWARRFGRSVLFDEVKLRASGDFSTLASLREANQWLKQEYQRLGDHVRSGDFHYAEMEAKRREYGFPGRWISWEYLYWVLSGYGIGHIRALLILIGLIAGFAGHYYWTKPEAFSGFGEALRYSIGVAAFQRPEMSPRFAELQKWLHVAEAVLGPLQIALFALALRMRLKR